MTPKEYLDRYTYLKFCSPVQGQEKAYGIGWAAKSNVKPVDTFRYIFKRPSDEEPRGWS